MADRPDLFRRLRDLPVVGRGADWELGPSAVSKDTKRAGSRIAGLKATESVCTYAPPSRRLRCGVTQAREH